MRVNIVWHVASVLGLILLSVTAAQAGGGPGVTSFSAFFECQNIEGATPVNEDVSIRDPSSASVVLHESVKVGAAQLLCRQVQVVDSSNALVSPPVGDRLKCYSIAVQGPLGAADFLNISDVAFGAETNVRVSGSRYLCGTTSVTE